MKSRILKKNIRKDSAIYDVTKSLRSAAHPSVAR